MRHYHLSQPNGMVEKDHLNKEILNTQIGGRRGEDTIFINKKRTN